MNNSDQPKFTVLIPFILSCAVQHWLFQQIHSKCAALAGGFHLKGLGQSLSGLVPQTLNNGVSNNSISPIKSSNINAITSDPSFISTSINKKSHVPLSEKPNV